MDLLKIKRCETCNSNRPGLLHRPCSDRAVMGKLPDDFHNTRHITALNIARELSIKHAGVLQKLAGGPLANGRSVNWFHSCADCGEIPCVCISSEPALNKCESCGSIDPAVRLPYEWPPEGSEDWVECLNAFHNAPTIAVMKGIEQARRGEGREIDVRELDVSENDAAVEMRERAADVCKEAANNLFQQRKAELQPSLWDVLITASTAILSLKIESDE